MKKKKISKMCIIAIALLAVVSAGIVGISVYTRFFASPVILITTGRYGQGTPEENEMISSVFGEDSQENFNIYFNWYNTIHEIGHAIIRVTGKETPHVVYEEQLVNDFAVAFWAHYGEEETFSRLETIVSYALGNLERPVDENISHIEYGRELLDSMLSGGPLEIDFNNYGWFQFSLANQSLANIRPLESVLAEMGVEFSEVPPLRTLSFSSLGEENIPQILAEVVYELRKWGVEFPDIYHALNDDPAMHVMTFTSMLGIRLIPGISLNDLTLVCQAGI